MGKIKKQKKVENNLTAEKGFLKQHDYTPDPEFELAVGHEKIENAPDSDSTVMKASLDAGMTKRPRPEVEDEIEDEDENKDKPVKVTLKTKKQPRFRLQKDRLSHAPKDPWIKRSNMIRYTMVVVGVLILLFAVVLSYYNFTTVADKEASLEKSGYEFMTELRSTESLVHEPEHGAHVWDSNKFLTLTSDDIISDLDFELGFLIEVHDLSSYPIKYNRTLENDLAWSNLDLYQISNNANKDDFTISMLVNIYVSSEELHLVEVSIRVWN